MRCSAKIVRLPSQAWRVLDSKLNPRNLEDARDFTSSDLSLKILLQLMNDRHPFKMKGRCCMCMRACMFLSHFSSSNVFIFLFMPLLLQLQPLYKPSLLLKLLQTLKKSKEHSFEVVKLLKNNLQGQIHKFFFNVDFYGTVIQPFTVEVKCFFNTITELLKWMLI